MLTIAASLRDAMVAHARRDHPDEACGVIAGPAGSDRPERFVPMTNAERSPTFYRFDPTEQLQLYREMDDRDEEPVVVYHAHTATEAYPSRTDVAYAGEPGAHYVLVSTRDPDVAEVRSYRIVDGQVEEEEVTVVEDEPDPDRCCGPTDVTHAHPERNSATVAIQVKIPTILRTYTDGSKTVSGEGATLGALLDDLDAHHPGLRGRLVQDDGSLHRFVNIYVNDEDVRFTGSLDTGLRDGDAVTILPAVAGG